MLLRLESVENLAGKIPYCLLYMQYVCICSHILFHIFCPDVLVKAH